ncbi:MAG: YveK family protein [Anaerolineae bacterium]
MELQEYIRILLRRGWIILLVAVIGGVSAYAFSKMFITPEYRSTVILSVNPGRGADYGSGLGIKNFLWNLSERMRLSDEIAQTVGDRLQMDLPPDTLKGRITTDPDEARSLIRLDAEEFDPIIAKQLAETWAEVSVERRVLDNQKLDQRDRIIMEVVQHARDGQKFKPRTKVNAAAGGVLGALLGGLIVLFLEFVEAGIIHSPEDVERYLETPVLGLIPPSGQLLAPSTAGQSRAWWQVWQTTD